MRVVRFPVCKSSVACLAAIIVLGGCAGGGVGRLDTATASVDETRAQLEAGSEQVDKVIEAFRGFSGDDLEKAFKRYGKEVDKLEDIADKVRARRAAMQTRMEDHIEKWRSELSDIQDERIREISMRRQEQLAAALGDLGAALDALKVDYQPFISNLRDIELVLANDLSVGGLEVARPLLDDAVDQAEDVKDSIAEANEQLANAIAEFQR